MHALIRKIRPQVITKVDRREPIPLTHPQRGLWLLDQLHPGNSDYNVPLAARLTGALDTSALDGALKGVAERHEALRTTVRAIDGEPCQHVGAIQRAPLHLTDLGGLAEGQREQHAQQLIDAWAHEPFDLATGPLVRARLIRLAEHDHVLVVVMHHIVCDGESIHLFFDELAAEYAGEERPPPPTVQYADYAVWQRSQSPDEDDLDWWRRYLEGVPTELALPTDHPRPAVRRAARRNACLHAAQDTGGRHVGAGARNATDAVHGLAHRVRGPPRTAHRS